jgi:hypothetical protein
VAGAKCEPIAPRPTKVIFLKMAPRDGFEPPTNGLTVRRSTTELPGNSKKARIVGKPRTEVKESGVSHDGVRHVGRLQLGDFRRLEMQRQGGQRVAGGVIPAMDLVQIHVLGPQALQAGVSAGGVVPPAGSMGVRHVQERRRSCSPGIARRL